MNTICHVKFTGAVPARLRISMSLLALKVVPYPSFRAEMVIKMDESGRFLRVLPIIDWVMDQNGSFRQARRQ